jgi:hypothetical protein
MPGAVQVAGSDLDEKKEEAFEAFTAGQIKTLVTKTSIGGFGMNWQHCQHMTFFPSHSFEQYYQGVRRCWRFGQDKPVDVDVVTTPGEAAVTANLRRKHEQAEALFESICAEMRSEYAASAREAHDQKESLPSWLS